jgi:hypothetical protein
MSTTSIPLTLDDDSPARKNHETTVVQNERALSEYERDELHCLEVLKTALYLVSKGFFVAPVCVHHKGWCRCNQGKNCSHPGKVPQLAHGYLNASNNEALVRDWFTYKFKGYNVGIAVGREFGVLVIESDVRDGGSLDLEALQAINGYFPETFVVGSGSGGLHYYFVYPDGELDMPTGHFHDLGLLYKGLEIKSKGGMVAPPSIHGSGNVYEFRSEPDVPVAQMPAWLYDLLEPQPKGHESSTIYYPGKFFSEITSRDIIWLWKDRIPIGKLTILDGHPGLGKSLVTIFVAAQVTNGQDMPDGSKPVQGSVIFISLEDDASDTIRPRLEAAGADLTKCLDLSTVRYLDQGTGEPQEYPFSIPRDIAVLEAEISRIGAVLVIIDPLMAVLDPLLKARDDQDVRQALTPLARLAENTGAAILIVRHLNKGSSDNALLRGAGSMGIIGAARSGMMIAEDPDDANRRILAMTKNNLRKRADNLVYAILENQHKQPYIEWLGSSSHSTAELLSVAKPSEGRQEILKVLKDAKEPMGPRDIVDETMLSYVQVRQLLNRMAKDGSIMKVSRGKYTLSQTSQLSQTTPTDELDETYDSNCDTEEECHIDETASKGVLATNVTVVTPETSQVHRKVEYF